MNPTRIWAIVLRHIFLTMHQLERFFDVFMFPVVALLLWGFLSKYAGETLSGLTALLVGGLILWIVFERIATNIGVDFMFDVWERNIMNILASPIKPSEYITGLVFVAIVKTIASFFAMWLVAGIFFGYNLGSLGFFLSLFFVNVVLFAVSFGILNVSIVIRWGATIGPLTWILPFIIQPFAAVFYPMSVLPKVFQVIGWFLPVSHVFEGMRYTVATGKFDYQEFWTAVVLNLVYFVLAVGLFAYMFNLVKKKGSLVKL